ncbi:alpha/beta hydrolase [Ahniella affigens]|uniref:Alpha/beta hydrolase n=1 Tax=Ahniella affigens TaxID=2021234 RepID=A0A2P1PYR1_9GAMM|nr:alpha/beta hydrolase fold domain-containing protein [Ahniella affigens]AVP99970.1 alpha/beta hydrolase [Ahniella affigens]
MPSLRARLIIALLKRRHWFRGQWRRPTIGSDTDIRVLRERAERGAARFGGRIDDLRIESVQFDQVAAEWLTPNANAREGLNKSILDFQTRIATEQIQRLPSDQTLLYFHGGGYVMGSIGGHRGIVAKLVRASGIRALHFDYRLAPEHPFPAALEDALTAYRGLLNVGIDPCDVAFVGDSAGAGLLLATLLALKDQAMPLPAAAAALSPWTDLACTGASYAHPDDLAPDGSFTTYAQWYAGQTPLTHPLVSPLYGVLQDLPPLFLCAGGAESMLDDTVAFAARARAAGINVTERIDPGMVHCYPLMAPLFPEATAAYQALVVFLQQNLAARAEVVPQSDDAL